MSESATICDALTTWYAIAKRDLPWRKTHDPYAIWLSEIMLQQTRVDTVVPYYERMLSRFPTVRSLAAAELDDVLSEWSGLGYYRRARALHRAAAEVVELHDGELPGTRDGLLALPGIGPYTAGAIASIAYGERAAIVDGNVTRVLTRLHGITSDVTTPATKRRIWQLAEELVPERDPGELNQALMELGATVCTPKKPRCDACPLASRCAAHSAGTAETLPRARAKRPPTEMALFAVVATCSPHVLLARRPTNGLFGGMWEPPMVPGDNEKDARKQLQLLGVSSRAKLERVGSVRHVLTHRVMQIEVLAGTPRQPWKLPENIDTYAELDWRSPSALPLSTLARKLLRLAPALFCLLFGLAVGGVARADDTPDDEEKADDTAVSADELELYRRLNHERGAYGRMFLTLGGGKGLRFNNPFRLSDQLGDGPESLSATAGYFDLSVNATLGDPDGVQHGGSLHLAIAVEGVGQQALSASYLLLHRGRSPLMLYGRLGVSFLTAPDFNAGGELGLGLAYFFTGGIGLTSELVGNLFYGAGTYEAEVTAVPVVSLQGGVIFDFEVLP